MRIFIVALGLLVFLLGCGIKGDPLPPERPPELGRGQPTYKRAVEDLRLPQVPVDDLEDEDEDDDDEDEDDI